MAEVTLLQNEPSLPLQDDDGKFLWTVVEELSKKEKDYLQAGYMFIMHSCHFSAFQMHLFCCRLDDCQGAFKFGPAYRK
jgi:hypothetical protein